MTNFEKWKAGLTLENLAMTFKVGELCCGDCPAESVGHCNGGDDCYERVMFWGEREAQYE